MSSTEPLGMKVDNERHLTSYSSQMSTFMIQGGWPTIRRRDLLK